MNNQSWTKKVIYEDSKVALIIVTYDIEIELKKARSYIEFKGLGYINLTVANTVRDNMKVSDDFINHLLPNELKDKFSEVASILKPLILEYDKARYAK